MQPSNYGQSSPHNYWGLWLGGRRPLECTSRRIAYVHSIPRQKVHWDQNGKSQSAINSDDHNLALHDGGRFCIYALCHGLHLPGI